MTNNVVLVGRLTKDPELRYSNSNIPMVKDKQTLLTV